jgi:hypothetical protein
MCFYVSGSFETCALCCHHSSQLAQQVLMSSHTLFSTGKDAEGQHPGKDNFIGSAASHLTTGS